MKRILIVQFVFWSGILASYQANALLDIRLGLTTNSGSPSNVNEFINAFPACGSAGCGVKSDKIVGGGADIIVSPPLFNMGFGLRYESLGAGVEYPEVAKSVFTYNRTALLLNYRFINTLLYFGPIVSYGIADTCKMKLEVASVSTEYTAKTNSSYTAGLEGGVKLGLFAIGAETGVASVKAKTFKDTSDSEISSGSVTLTEMDYTGAYFKIHLGIKF
jgi:hypothetical protein